MSPHDRALGPWSWFVATASNVGSYTAMGVLVAATRWSVRWDESTRSWNLETFDDSTERCPSDGVYRVEWFGVCRWFDADGCEVSP